MTVDPRFHKLFEPARIGRLELKNRIIMPPMGTNFPTIAGEASDAHIDWYVARARGGTGLIFVEVALTAPAIDPLKQIGRMLRLDDDGFATGLSQIAEAVHEAGARVGIELSPGMSSQARLGPWLVGQPHIQDVLAVGPSGVPHPEVKRPARALSIEEIEKIVELSGYSAAWAKRAGFDMIELHAHSAFLVGQFLSPYFNRRTDKYGGIPERRLRFLLEIVESMRRHIGADIPISVKYSVDEFLEGGRDAKEGQFIARRLEQAGIDAITVSSGIHGSRLPSLPTMYYPEGTFIPLAEAVKEAVSLPVILPGRLGDPALAERVLEEGKADFIAWGRPLIADPDLPNKVAAGHLDEIRRCVSCNECIRVMWDHNMPVRCTVNPVAGREGRYGRMARADRSKKVAIVGAGPAGMEAARVAALQGHQVVLCDRDSELGGLLKLAAAPPHKDVFQYVINYYRATFKRLSNVELRLGQEATTEWILSLRPDAVIIACGAVPSLPQIPGAPAHRLVNAFDVLAGRATVGDRVVINKGGLFGCETANLLARQGKKVTVVEPGEVEAADMERVSWAGLRHELEQAGVEVLTRATIEEVASQGVLAVRVIGADGNDRVLLADRLVIVPELRPNNGLARELAGRVDTIEVIGDAKQPRRSREAISEGFMAGYHV